MVERVKHGSSTGSNQSQNKQRQRPRTSLWKGVGLLLPFISVAHAQQQIGVDICSCAPSTYEFTLDFSLFCPPVNITLGDAVTDTTCMVSPFGDPNVADLIPVAVQSIDILELDQNLQILVQENLAGSYGDGDTFQYTSIAAVPGDIVDPANIPRAIQLNIIGVNQFDEPIINVYLIIFSNNCGRYPVLFEGQYAGWTRFTDLQPPSPELCPAVPTVPPTAPPTVPPTMPPTVPPTVPPTLPPTTISPPPSTPFPTFIDMSMSMSMSMSMDLGMSMDLLDLMSELDDAAEFGRVPEMKIRDPARKKKDKMNTSENTASQRGKGATSTKTGHSDNLGKGGKGVYEVDSDYPSNGAKGSKGSDGDSEKFVKSNKGGKKGGSSKGSQNDSTESAKASKTSKAGNSDESLKTKVYSAKKESIAKNESDSSSKKGSKSEKKLRRI